MNLSISHDIIHGCRGKKLDVFLTFCHVHCLKTKTSPKKFYELKEVVRFEGKETFKLEFEFNFVIFSTNYMCYSILKFDIFSLFAIFNYLNAFDLLIFKNLFPVGRNSNLEQSLIGSVGPITRWLLPPNPRLYNPLPLLHSSL
jgi:hypothetical protein